MPFGDIVVNTKTYKPTLAGVYRESSTSYDSPVNEFRITGATSTKGGFLTGSVRRIHEKDVSVGSDVARRQALISVEIRVDQKGGFATADIDTLISDVSEFLTPDTISRVLQGES